MPHGFNEAPAFHRGKGARKNFSTGSIHPCFNEAPAFHRGKAEKSTGRVVEAWSFNEAPAFHRGKATTVRKQHFHGTQLQ